MNVYAGRIAAAAMLSVAAAAVLISAPSAQTREQIRIVGSSTVYPFASYVAEEFGAVTEHATPVVESTGSGGGFKLFCQGVGDETPDITNSSRRMQVSEFEQCRENGVKNITEAVIGYDGIVLAQNAANEPFNITLEQLALAVAQEVPQKGELVKNPYKRWNDIDDDLPDRPILIYGPPTTSGTRDAFEELVLEKGTAKIPGYGEKYTRIRQDVYIPSGENDNLIVQKLANNRLAFGIFGFSFLEENRDRIQAASIDDVAPQRQTISSGQYPVSRDLFFYVKNAHRDRVPGISEFVTLFVSEKMIGEDGFLRQIGLVPLAQALRTAVRQRVDGGETLEVADLSRAVFAGFEQAPESSEQSQRQERPAQ